MRFIIIISISEIKANICKKLNCSVVEADLRVMTICPDDFIAQCGEKTCKHCYLYNYYNVLKIGVLMS